MPLADFMLYEFFSSKWTLELKHQLVPDKSLSQGVAWNQWDIPGEQIHGEQSGNGNRITAEVIFQKSGCLGEGH